LIASGVRRRHFSTIGIVPDLSARGVIFARTDGLGASFAWLNCLAGT
jgi:hypothetical protein